MNLYRVRPNKALRWPAEFTPIPEGKQFTRRGERRFRELHRVERGAEGFVVDLDAPGEPFFVGVDERFLEPVPRDEIEDAREAVAEQGPITFQPALDYLDDLGLREKVARPADPEPVEEDGPASWDRDRLKVECDRLGIEVGKRRTETLRDEVIARLAEPVEATEKEVPE